MTSSLNRIKALFIQELMITRHSLEMVMDVFVITVASLLVFGYFALFAARFGSPMSANFILLGFILWEVVHTTQFASTMPTMWNIWPRNLNNLFTTPLTMGEYIFGQGLIGAVKTAAIFLIVSWVALSGFDFNIFALPPATLIGAYLILTLFGWATSLVILGLIFAFGTRIQAFTWGLIYLFQPLTAAFYPVSILPEALQKLAYVLPPTYAFEAARSGLTLGTVEGRLMLMGFALSLIYFGFGAWLFIILSRWSRQRGQFAKLE